MRSASMVATPWRDSLKNFCGDTDVAKFAKLPKVVRWFVGVPILSSPPACFSLLNILASWA